MKDLNQYLSEAKGDYTHACVKTYRRSCRKKLFRQVSGDIDFVQKYFKNDPYGTTLMISGRFSPDACHASGLLAEVTCTYRLCDSHRNHAS